MSKFQPYLEKIAAYIQERRDSGIRVRNLTTADAVSDIRTGPGAGADLVLKRDTFLELGNPNTASCAIALYSNECSSVHSSRVTLIGPDIPESSSSTLPFGQALIAAGKSLTDDDYETLLEAQYVSDAVEGYMVRSSSSHLWCRVSKDAAAKGFNFATLGRAIVQHVKAEVPRVEAVELVFITSSKEDVDQLSSIGIEVDKVARDIRQKVWQQRGVDIFECTKSGHCGKCSDKAVCDRIREISGERKNNPEFISE